MNKVLDTAVDLLINHKAHIEGSLKKASWLAPPPAGSWGDQTSVMRRFLSAGS